MMSTKTCILCFGPVLKGTDCNLVNGKSKIIVELQDLPFVGHDCSPYICKKCLGVIKKRSNLKKNLKIVEDELTLLYRQKCGEHGFTIKRSVFNNIQHSRLECKNSRLHPKLK